MTIHRKDNEKLVEFCKRAMNTAAIYGNKVIRAFQGKRMTLVYPEDDRNMVIVHMTLVNVLNNS